MLFFFLRVNNNQSVTNGFFFYCCFVQASCPDDYRGKFNRYNSSSDTIKDQYIAEVESIAKKVADEGRGIAAFIAESLQSCGGQIIPPEGYFEDIYR